MSRNYVATAALGSISCARLAHLMGVHWPGGVPARQCVQGDQAGSVAQALEHFERWPYLLAKHLDRGSAGPLLE